MSSTTDITVLLTVAFPKQHMFIRRQKFNGETLEAYIKINPIEMHEMNIEMRNQELSIAAECCLNMIMKEVKDKGLLNDLPEINPYLTSDKEND